MFPPGLSSYQESGVVVQVECTCLIMPSYGYLSLFQEFSVLNFEKHFEFLGPENLVWFLAWSGSWSPSIIQKLGAGQVKINTKSNRIRIIQGLNQSRINQTCTWFKRGVFQTLRQFFNSFLVLFQSNFSSKSKTSNLFELFQTPDFFFFWNLFLYAPIYELHETTYIWHLY